MSAVVDILLTPDEATIMLCPEKSPRLSMIILIECDDEYHRNCCNMFYKYFKDSECIFVGYKSSKEALSVVVMDSRFKDIVPSKADSGWLEVW